METLFLRVFAVSAAVSLLLLPLLSGRRWMEKTYSPETRWGLWLALALVLLIAPWVPKPQAPVMVEAPAYTVTLPVLPGRAPAAPKAQPADPAVGKAQPAPSTDHTSPARPGIQVGSNTPSAVQTEARPAAQRPAVSITALLSTVWLAGLTLVLLRQGLWYLLARRRLLRASTPVTGLEHYAAELDLEGRVTFYHCKAVPGPMTLGVWRPAVLLPPDGLAVAALRHELYHVKRRDVAYKVLLLCACALHWFDPLVWLMYRQADRDVEACCDAAVVAGQDSGYKRSYGELLLTAAAGPQPLPFTTSFSGEAEQMKARLTQLFRPGKQSKALVCLVLALAVALGSLVACREKGELKDGLYCATAADVLGSYPVGEPDAEGEDYGSIRLSLLEFSETDGPHGKPLGEHVLPLSAELTLRDGYDPGEKGTRDWQERVAEFLEWPIRRNSIPVGTEYLVLETAGGEVVCMFWIEWPRDDTLYRNETYRFTLRLPESWAGNYTAREQGQEILFLYRENDQPLLTLRVTPQADDREGWEIVGINDWYVYAQIPAGEEDTPWGGLREDLREQLAGDSGFGWMDVGLSPEEGYTDQHYGFTLRLPESWVGRYMVEQGNDEYGLFWRFFQRSGDGTKAGELFTIDLRNVGKDEGEAPTPDAARGRGVLGIRDRGDYWEVYRMTSPTWTSERREGYEEMRDDVWDIAPADFGFITGTPESQPLTENTMPTLVYYDPARDFLLYHTVDTAYLRYGDTMEEFHATRDGGRRVLWRCDVSEDEKTVYLSDVYDDSTARDERSYAWDIGGRTLTAVGSLPAGVDHMTHLGSEELFYSGFMNGTPLKSNVIKTRDGTLTGLYIDELLGNTIEYLQLARMREDGTYEAEGSALGINAFLTPERIPAPRTYTDPAWGFTLQLPESLEGNYVVSRAANNWNFYNKELYPLSGYLFSLWAEDSARQQGIIDAYNKILGEKNGITYTLTTWPEDHLAPEERDNAGHITMLRDVWEMSADALDLTAVTRSSGYLWPLPYTGESGIVILRGFEEGEHEHTDILAPSSGYAVQSMAAGEVTSVYQNRVSGRYEVTVAHDGALSSCYGNLDLPQVQKGDRVARGDYLGFAGEQEGHWVLQFALLEEASYLDPLTESYRMWDFTTLDREELTFAGDTKNTDTLRKVLYGDATFYNVETGEYCYADALPFSDGQPVKVYRFTELDMDGDTIPEMVLWLQRGEDIYQLGSIILRYQSGMVCGYPMGYRSLELDTLKADGTYAWSGGASNWGWGKMNFQTGKTDDISWVEGESSYVDGRSSTREAFYRANDEREARPDVDWHDLSEATLDSFTW